MADKTTIARPYAKAAFAHARAANALGAWSAALTNAAAVVADPRVRPLLTSPHVTSAQLAELVNGIATRDLDDAGRNFIGALADNHRLGVLTEVAALFNSMKDEAERTIDVEVTSAATLNDAQRAELASSLEKRLKRSVRLNCAVDPALLGGAVLRAGDLVIDGSVRARLERLAHELTA
jgi:F-type H+-transporting ATPase subunit delta